MLPREVVESFYEAWREGAVTELYFLVREDVDIAAPMAHGVPMGGRCRGRAQIAAFVQVLRGAVDLAQFDVAQVFASGDVVVVMGFVEGVVRDTGRPFETGFTHVFTIRGGHVARLRVFFDRSVADAFATAPSPSPHRKPRRAA
jgi:ketosteroid isomerase-like protein